MLTDSSAGLLAGPTAPAGLVLERLHNGEYAWLRRRARAAAIRAADRLDQDLTRTLGWPEPQPESTEPYKEILWFERYVDGKPVQVATEDHQQHINGYVAAALENKTGRVQAGPFRFRVKQEP